MDIKLFDSELRVMRILWRDGDCSARHIAEELKKQVGWSKTTSYTVIKKCAEKGALTRIEPGYICHAVYTADEVREYETAELIDKLYDGSGDMLVTALVKGNKLSPDEIKHLKELVDKLDGGEG